MSNLTKIELNGAEYDLRDEISGYVTRGAGNLTNYYTKAETYTKDEVNTLIGSGGGSASDPSAVKYTPQTLTTAQKSQARSNIGAGDYTKPSGGITESDLSSSVRTSLGKADTAVQTETDPTVPSWAKSPNKPTYSASEVGALASNIPVVRYDSQSLTAEQKAQVRANIGAVSNAESGVMTVLDISIDQGTLSAEQLALVLTNNCIIQYTGTTSNRQGLYHKSFESANGIDYWKIKSVRSNPDIESYYFTCNKTTGVYNFGTETDARPRVSANGTIQAGDTTENLENLTIGFNKYVIPQGASAADLAAVTAKIPSEASSSNQLADKDFVRTYVSSSTGDLITDNGQPWSSLSALQSYSGTIHTNDYAFVVTTSGNDTITSRYKYNGSSWEKEYDISSTTLSQAQQSAVDSGITTAKVSGYDSHVADTDIHITAAEHASLTGLISDQVFAAGTGTDAAVQIAGGGQSNAASGDRSLAIGERNTASGRASVAEGTDTNATATNAHAMGNKCLASGGASLATGVQNVASEVGSFAQGICTVSSAQGAVSMNGGFRLQISLSGAANGTSYTGTRYGTNGEDARNDLDLINQFGYEGYYADFLVGCILRQSSSSPLARITACTVTVNRNQNDELTGVTYQITTDRTLSESALDNVSYNICLNKASGPCSTSINASAAIGQYSHAGGHHSLAFGVASHAEGRRTVTRNEGEHAEGEYNVSYKASDDYDDPGNSIHTIGVGTEETARQNAFTVMRNGDIYVKGVGTYDGITLTGASTLQSVVSGKQDTLSSGVNIKTINSQPLTGSGNLTINEDPGLFAAGSGTDSIVHVVDSGNTNAASGDRSLVIGERNTASGRASIAGGTESQATNTDSVVLGNRSLASGAASLVTGVQNVASETGAFAQGICTVASAQGAVAMNGGFRLQILLTGAANGTSYTGTRYGTNGEDARNDLDLINQFGSVSAYASFLVGCAIRQGTSSPLVRITACTVTVNRDASDNVTGIYYQITTDKTLSETALSNVSYNLCLNKATGPCSNASNASSTIGTYSHAEGHQSLAFGVASHAEGRRTVTRNEGEHAEGEYNVSYKNSDSYDDPGNSLHTIGVGTEESARKNAVTIMRNGDIYIKSVGSYDGINLASASTLQSVITSLQNTVNGIETLLAAI